MFIDARNKRTGVRFGKCELKLDTAGEISLLFYKNLLVSMSVHLCVCPSS